MLNIPPNIILYLKGKSNKNPWFYIAYSWMAIFEIFLQIKPAFPVPAGYILKGSCKKSLFHPFYQQKSMQFGYFSKKK